MQQIALNFYEIRLGKNNRRIISAQDHKEGSTRIFTDLKEKQNCRLFQRLTLYNYTGRFIVYSGITKRTRLQTRPFMCGINNLLKLGVCASRNEVVAH